MMKKKHIVFLLPEYYETPIGGYRVVFEYSNRLVADGNDVSIVYPYFLYFAKSSIKRKLKMVFFFFYYLFFKRMGVTKWFPLDKRIDNKFVLNLSEENVPSADIFVATAMETANFLAKYVKPDYSQKFYLIQALEDWQWGREVALATWKLRLNKIVISSWLQSISQSLNEQSVLIENGIDRTELKRIISSQQRDKYTIMMLYHKQKLKGCAEGLKALEILKLKYPMLKSIWFGCPDRPSNLPDWIDYFKLPNEVLLNELYNQSGIFIGTSYSEGFGLTVGEAMLCGCAVACTDAGGYLTMAKNRETALVSSIGDIEGLVENIVELIEDDELRYKISEAGYNFVQQFTWNKAYDKFHKYLIENPG
jgi:glycosyltransferase involved in cell wall biosynthesis